MAASSSPYLWSILTSLNLTAPPHRSLPPPPSGCLFFLSDDEKFLVKTMRKSESKTLIDMLPAYYRHMEANPGSLITRFYGVYGVKQVHGRTVRSVMWMVWIVWMMLMVWTSAPVHTFSRATSTQPLLKLPQSTPSLQPLPCPLKHPHLTIQHLFTHPHNPALPGTVCGHVQHLLHRAADPPQV